MLIYVSCDALVMSLCGRLGGRRRFNFLIPQIAPKNPIAEKLTQLAGTSGVDPSKIQEMADAFSAKFGLDRPLWEQYLHYFATWSRSISAARSRSIPPRLAT